MKHRTLVTVGALAVLAAAALLALPAGASSGPTTMHLLDISVSDTPAFDAGHGAPRPGDRVFLNDALYAWDGAHRGARVGHVDSELQFRSTFGRKGASADITGEIYLLGGSVAVDGIGFIPSEGPASFSLPVIGGTGKYIGARGELDTRDLASGGSKAAFDLHLLATSDQGGRA
ncbi:MAG: hypothetical protein ACXVRK_13155 [Gaiellaceae bacterium]